MHWTLWVVFGYFIVSAFVTISMIGKPRERTTPGVAAVVVAIIGVLALLIVIGGHAS